MMSKILGAPFGGTTRGGHQGVESLALSLITPPNFGGGAGSCFPSSVVVALGEPGVPVTCCAAAGTEDVSPSTAIKAAIPRVLSSIHFMISLLPLTCQKDVGANSSAEIRDAIFQVTDAALGDSVM